MSLAVAEIPFILKGSLRYLPDPQQLCKQSGVSANSRIKHLLFENGTVRYMLDPGRARGAKEVYMLDPEPLASHLLPVRVQACIAQCRFRIGGVLVCYWRRLPTASIGVPLEYPRFVTISRADSFT